MANLTSNLSNMERAVEEAVGAHWRLFMFQGIVMIMLGIAAVVVPIAATLAVDLFIGWLFLFGGIAGLAALFSARDIPAFLWGLVTAALNIVVGGLLLWKPLTGAISLTFVLTAFFVVEGTFQIVTSVAYRNLLRGSWGWMLVSGIADLLLVVVIISGWPTTAAWTLGLIVGINLISSGWAIVTAALAGREVAQKISAPPKTAYT
jgi:uncharacterized membrane protein HdeD (DUF308 family)